MSAHGVPVRLLRNVSALSTAVDTFVRDGATPTHCAFTIAEGLVDEITALRSPPPREYDDCLHCGRVPTDHVCTWKEGFGA